MEKVAEFPAPLDPPTVDVSETSDKTTEAPQVASVLAKSTRPRLPVIFYRLMPKPRLKAVEQVLYSEFSLLSISNKFLETAYVLIEADLMLEMVQCSTLRRLNIGSIHKRLSIRRSSDHFL